MPRRDVDLEVVLVQGATEVTSWPLGRAGRPDLSWVEELARLQVAARRLGCSIRLRGAGSRLRELADLLDLTGLGRIVTIADGLVVEVHGKPEGGEEIRVEEGVEPGDAPF